MTQQTTDPEATVFDPCPRCSGDGVVHYGMAVYEGYVHGNRTKDRICFKCNGRGGKYVTQTTLDRRTKDREYRARKAQRDAEKKRAEAEAQIATLVDERPLLVWLTYPDYTQHEAVPGFLTELATKLAKYGELSERQIAAAEKTIVETTERTDARAERDREKAAKIAAGVQAPEGRVTIEGDVVKVKIHDSEWGVNYKMVVRTDEGWAVWTTVPQSLYDEPGVNELTGARVRFDASLTRSDDDPLFAFAKRPTKAAMV